MLFESAKPFMTEDIYFVYRKPRLNPDIVSAQVVAQHFVTPPPQKKEREVIPNNGSVAGPSSSKKPKEVKRKSDVTSTSPASPSASSTPDSTPAGTPTSTPLSTPIATPVSMPINTSDIGAPIGEKTEKTEKADKAETSEGLKAESVPNPSASENIHVMKSNDNSSSASKSNR